MTLSKHRKSGSTAKNPRLRLALKLSAERQHSTAPAPAEAHATVADLMAVEHRRPQRPSGKYGHRRQR